MLSTRDTLLPSADEIGWVKPEVHTSVYCVVVWCAVSEYMWLKETLHWHVWMGMHG